MEMAADSYYMYKKDSMEDRGEDTFSFDPFFTKENMVWLNESDRQVREGKVVVKAMEELEAMELE